MSPAEIQDSRELVTHESPQSSPERVSLWQLMGMLLRHRILLFLVTSGVTVAGLILIVVASLTPQYTAEASFLPEESATGGNNLNSFARQLGFSASVEGGLGSPQFQARLLESRRLLGEVARAQVTAQTDSGRVSGPLMNIVNPGQADPELQRVQTIGWLREHVETEVDNSTGVVEVAATADSPSLAHSVLSRLLDLTAEMNVSMRQAQATAEREFIQEQLAARRAELKAAEDSLQQFLQNNRQFQDSPELLFIHDRLQRTVMMRQQIVTSLAQSLEQARIEEVRNTPALTLLDAPEMPLRPDGTGWPVKVVLLLIVAVTLGVLTALARGLVEAQRKADLEAYQEAAALFQEAKKDIRGVFKRGA